MALGGPDAKVPDAWYERPAFYFSNPHATTGPGDAIEPPAQSSGLDLELEVARVIGRRARNIAVDEASDCIVGYTIFNDWSERGHRSAGGAACRSAFTRPRTSPTRSARGSSRRTNSSRYREGDRLDLRMTAHVNGAELGSDTLANMAWSFEELVHFAARGAWIGPGDVIGSGTCGGGCLFELWGRNQAQEPPPLTPGDEVRLRGRGDRHADEQGRGLPARPARSPPRPCPRTRVKHFAFGTFAGSDGVAVSRTRRR